MAKFAVSADDLNEKRAEINVVPARIDELIVQMLLGIF
jgi:hypothetical protein